MRLSLAQSLGISQILPALSQAAFSSRSRCQSVSFEASTLVANAFEYSVKLIAYRQRQHSDSTASWKLQLEERRRSASRQISAYVADGFRFMPFAFTDFVPPSAELHPEDVVIPIPSTTLPCEESALERQRSALRAIEAKLRFAQAQTALGRVRCSLRVRELLSRSRTKVRGHHESTRAGQKIHELSDNIKRYASQYRRARRAYMAIKGEHEMLHELKDADLVPLQADTVYSEPTERLGAGYYTGSWIWRVPGAEDDRETREC